MQARPKLVGLEYLENSRDPLVITDGHGTIQWHNRAFLGLALPHRQITELQDFIVSQDVDQITKVQGYRTLAVQLQLKSKRKLPQTLVVLEISNADPDSDLRLIAFLSKSATLEASKERERFLATLTHDLKNPLGSVFGYADVLLDTPAGNGLSTTQRDIIAKIRRTAQRTIEMVRNQQLYSQIQLSGIASGITHCDLNAIVRGVIEHTWRDESIGPKLHLDLCKAKAPCLIERTHLERVVSNLFSNALKFTPSNGCIKISTRLRGNFAELVLFNSDSFITKQELKSIFQMYSRTASSEGHPGSGLGLFIVKQLIDLAKGEIKIVSARGKGTTVTVTLLMPT